MNYRERKQKIATMVYRIKYRIFKKHMVVKNICSIEQTIEKIIEERVSVSRFGDGELRWILKEQHDSFETASDELSLALKEVLISHEPNHIVCISPALADLAHADSEAKKYWEAFMGIYGFRLKRLFDKDRQYFNADITRFYISSSDRSLTQYRFELLKKIWNYRRILIVEGEYSRLGVGNDLFDNALNIRRILAPARNAFSCYPRIVQCVKQNYVQEELVLIALGPTATVLAFELAKAGIQAIDIGHVDVEYEWFIRGYDKKGAIPGKAVNEAKDDRSHEKLPKEIYDKYKSQIISHVE